jgi:hypothetical protein
MLDLRTMKRAVGRPRTGKVKLILYVAPEIKTLIDHWAAHSGLRRSAFVESLVRKFLAKQ